MGGGGCGLGVCVCLFVCLCVGDGGWLIAITLILISQWGDGGEGSEVF